MRNADDANEVIILLQARDLDRTKAFTSSDDLRQTMQAVGVVDKPDIYFVNE